jgi:AAA domain-containing protein
MPLKIVKASELIHVDQIVLTLYAQPGGRKSTLGFTADLPISLDFDEGVYRAFNRGDSVICKSWSDAASITKDDLAPYKTLVVDTAGRALDKLAADIIQRDPKMGRGGALTLQGYGRLKAEFIAWLKMVRSFGLDVVLLAHLDESKQGDDTIERIDAQGSSKNEIYKSSDAMGRLAIRGGKTYLLFSPTDTAFGKNPAAFDPLEVPMFRGPSNFLGSVIRDIKAKLNAMSAEQQDTAALMAQWNDRVQKCTSADALSKLIAVIPTLDSRIHDNAKRLLASFAKDVGYVFDKKAGGYKEASAKAVTA